MKVTVLGAGIVGLTTAHYLIKKGHSVTIVDRADAVACGASYGNGGQLSYSFTDPINGPSLIGGLPSFLFGRDEGITINPHNLQSGQEQMVADRCRAVLTGRVL